MIAFSSARLRFRELKPDDVTASYISWMNNPAVNEFLETRFVQQNTKTIREFVATQLSSPDAFLLRIALAEDDVHIGNIKLGPVNHHHLSAQISLLIGETALHGQGYATEAIDRVTRWGFEEHGLLRIEGGCYDTNLGSLRAFLKVGYTVEGFRRNAITSAQGARIGAFWFARLASDSPNEEEGSE